MQARRQDAGEEDGAGQLPHPLLIKGDDAGGQVGGPDLAAQLQGQEGEAVGDQEQDQAGEGQRQGALQALRPVTVQRGATAPAAQDRPGGQGRVALQQVAFQALGQGVRRHRRRTRLRGSGQREPAMAG